MWLISVKDHDPEIVAFTSAGVCVVNLLLRGAMIGVGSVSACAAKTGAALAVAHLIIFTRNGTEPLRPRHRSLVRKKLVVIENSHDYALHSVPY